MTRKKKLSIAIGLWTLVAVGALLFVLLSRGPGEDITALAQTTQTVSSRAATSGSDGTETASTASASTSDTGDTVTESTTEVAEASSSDSTNISITKVSTGSGADTITYYVADVQVSSGTALQAGLADNGRGVADTSDIAEACGAVFAINGDYFGARDDGIIIRNGVIYRDVPVRTGLALYEDGHMEVYDETSTSAEELLAQGVWNTYSFGPALLIDGTIPDNVGTYEVEANPKHPVQGRNPRTGIGIIDNDHFIFVVVDGRSQGYSKGVTTEELAQIFKDLGCVTAYNLDGGGSSTMYYQGEVVNQPASRGGQRDISDILFIG